MTVRRKGLASTETTENWHVLWPWKSEDAARPAESWGVGLRTSGYLPRSRSMHCGRSSRRGKILVMGWVCESLWPSPSGVYPTFDHGKPGRSLKTSNGPQDGPQVVWCYCPVLSSPRDPRALGVSPFGQMRPLNSSWTKVGKEVRLKAMKVTIWKSDLQLSAESLVGEDLDKKSGSEDTADWWPFLNRFITGPV